MRKPFVILLFLHLVHGLSGQIPAGYYSAAEGLTGNNLKTALYHIIKGHTEYPYTSSSTDVWDILKETDRDTANPANVILFYTGWSVNAMQEYNNGSGWNREHVWAKSRGDFGTTKGPGTDAHHLRPADISVNSARNNRWFDNCTEPYLDNGDSTGCFTSSTSWVWQPRKEVKGDVARMIFYMATRYEGENGEPDLEMLDYIPADNDTKEPIHAKLSALLQWHEDDPVDNWERHKNDIIYSYQHNRNPYIDHPEYVAMIWNNITTAGKHPDRDVFILFPNPAKDIVHIRKPENYEAILYSTTGIMLRKFRQNTVDISRYKPGQYLIILTDPQGEKAATGKLVIR